MLDAAIGAGGGSTLPGLMKSRGHWPARRMTMDSNGPNIEYVERLLRKPQGLQRRRHLPGLQDGD